MVHGSWFKVKKADGWFMKKIARIAMGLKPIAIQITENK